MITRAVKLRFRRRLRLKQRQVEELGLQTEQHLERNLFRRLERLRFVRRFVVSWVLLLVLLAGCQMAQIRALGGHYQILAPVPGGAFHAGILGSFTTANPIYATGPVDSTVARLVFASLYTYNDKNQLVGDLAAGQWTVDDRGVLYTVRLRPNLTWQDGRRLTSEDVVFTYQVIQNPDARSPLRSNWQGIKVTAVDPLTVTFELPNSYAAFPHSLTNGIVPKHLLGAVPMADMRTAAFNTAHPVGAGPFAWEAIEVTGGAVATREERVALKPFKEYHAGTPKLSGFVVHAFRSQDRLLRSFERQELTAMAGLNGGLPDNLKNNPDVWVHNLPLTAAVMTFFRTDRGVLADAKVRRALVAGADTGAVLKALDYPTHAVTLPLLRGQAGYNPAYAQAKYDPAAANAQLDAEGWTHGTDGIRARGSTRLSFSLSTPDIPEYKLTASLLQKYWRALGVDVSVATADTASFQTRLASHDYDALLYGISIGADPDVFAYWDSKQNDPLSANRLNFSEYKSTAADTALEAARTRADPNLRAVKYQPFLQAWQADAPALALYQPRFLYITWGPVHGLSQRPINADTDHLKNVHNWLIRQALTTP